MKRARGFDPFDFDQEPKRREAHVRAVEILQEQFEAELRCFHRARVRVFFATVLALFRGGRLSLTALGRAIAETTTHKHGIKRVDRLFGNVVLQ